MDPDVVWLSISPSGEEFYQFFIIAHHFFIDITVCSSSALCRSLSFRITSSLILLYVAALLYVAKLSESDIVGF